MKGRIKDALTNESLTGCTIVIKGSQRGTTTDANGDYSISVPDGNAILVFGFIGYEKQEVVVGNRAVINIDLKAEASELSQVVLLAMAARPRRT